jgi:hypothetical protein
MEAEEKRAIVFVIAIIIFGGGGLTISFLRSSDVFNFFSVVFSATRSLLTFLSVVALFILSYATIKVVGLLMDNSFVFGPKDREEDEEYEIPVNKDWQRVQRLFNSENPSDWKIAILEADIMLEDLVRIKMGYTGETLGECLKQIEASDFTTLQEAWEAHNFRNRIAHESDSGISRRDVNRIIGLFEKVFREFSYI